MKKITLVLSIVLLSFFFCGNLVEAKNITIFDAFINFSQETTTVDPGSKITVSQWRNRNYMLSNSPSDSFGNLSYGEGHFQSVAKGSILQINLTLKGVELEDYKTMVMAVKLTGIPGQEDRPHFFLTKDVAEYFGLIPTSPVSQGDFQRISEEIEKIEDEAIKAGLKKSSMFLLDLSVIPYNYNSLILWFGVLHEGNRSKISFLFFSWERKSEGYSETVYEIGTHILNQTNGYAIGFADVYGAVNNIPVQNPNDAQWNQRHLISVAYGYPSEDKILNYVVGCSVYNVVINKSLHDLLVYSLDPNTGVTLYNKILVVAQVEGQTFSDLDLGGGEILRIDDSNAVCDGKIDINGKSYYFKIVKMLKRAFEQPVVVYLPPPTK